MNNHSSSLRRINYPHMLLIAGVLLSLAVVMFRPAGAAAVLPKYVDVFPSFDDQDTPASVKIKDQPTVTADYSIVLKKGGKPVKAQLTGIPLEQFLKAGDVKLDNVQFTRVRFIEASNALLGLYTLGGPHPPMLVTSGRVPGIGSIGNRIIPGQPDLDTPINAENFREVGKNRIQFLAGKPGASIMKVRIKREKLSGNKMRLTARVDGSSRAKTYEWYTFDSNGKPKAPVSGPSVKVDTTGISGSMITATVVVTETSTGSVGTSGTQWAATTKEKGNTTDPNEPTGSTGSDTSGSGTGTGTGTGTGSGTSSSGISGGSTGQLPPATNSYTPPSSTTTQPTPATTQPDSQTVSPAETAPAVDTTTITNTAQNAAGVGGLTTVSGVLLSAPTSAPAADGGGQPITALPAPVATELNSIFRPVDSTDDIWAYLLAVLFAFSISGAVREWVNP
jgi:hypothetical protein